MYQEAPPCYTEFIPALTQPYNHTLTYCIGYGGVHALFSFVSFFFQVATALLVTGEVTIA